MRYFFHLFLLILCFLSSQNNIALGADGASEQPSKMAVFMEFAGDLSYLNSPFSQRKGIGEWKENKFTHIRLISSDSGTKGLEHIWMALEVQLNTGTIMNRPLLSLKESKNVKNIQIFWPIQLPLEPQNGLQYTGSTSFPIKITLQKENYPTDVQIALTADFCKQECTRETILAELSVPAGQNYYTPFSSFIRNSLQFTPNIATSEQLQLGCLSPDILWLKANLNEKIQNPTFLILNKETYNPIHFDLKHTVIENNQALFTFKTTENIESMPLLIFMHTENQIWQINQIAEKKKIPPIFDTAQTNKLPLYLWLFFMLMLPSFALFVKQKPKNEIIAKKQSLKNMLLVLTGTLCGVFIYKFYPYSALVNSHIWLSFCLLMFAFLGYFSYPVTAFGYGILNALVPFFAFFEKMQVPIPTSYSELIYFFAVLSSIASLPFLLGILKPIIVVRLGKNLNGQISPLLRFPIWLDTILFIYLNLMLLFG